MSKRNTHDRPQFFHAPHGIGRFRRIVGFARCCASSWRRRIARSRLGRTLDLYLPDVTDLRIIYLALATIEEANRELGYSDGSRVSLVSQIDGCIISGCDRPGVALVQLADHFEREVNYHRLRTLDFSRCKTVFVPHPIPTTELFLHLARLWPETDKETNSFLRFIVGQYPDDRPRRCLFSGVRDTPRRASPPSGKKAGGA